MGEGRGRAGDAGGWLFEPTFKRAIKPRRADPRITSDTGALLPQEADHRLGLTADLAAQWVDHRRPDRIAASRSNCCASTCTLWRWATRPRTTMTPCPTTWR